MKRAFTVLCALAGLQALLLTFGVMPASANASQGYVMGGGVVTNDWGDEGTMSRTRNIDTGATALWQYVLWADGAKKSNGALFAQSDIDGVFGTNTAAATRNWQSRHDVEVDGVVGPQTFGAADRHLRMVEDDSQPGLPELLFVDYVGSLHTAEFIRIGGVYGYHSGVPGIMFRANYVPPCIDDGTCS